jgi:Arc/MetJ-type ribon-helix-helix transcriptional regulator
MTSFLQAEVTRGAFRDRDDALNAAINLLKSRQELVRKIEEGYRQLEAGEFTDYDEQGLQRRFEELKARSVQHASRTAATQRQPQE